MVLFLWREQPLLTTRLLHMLGWCPQCAHSLAAMGAPNGGDFVSPFTWSSPAFKLFTEAPEKVLFIVKEPKPRLDPSSWKLCQPQRWHHAAMGLALSHQVNPRTLSTPIHPCPLRALPIERTLLHLSSKWKLTSLEHHHKPSTQADTSLWSPLLPLDRTSLSLFISVVVQQMKELNNQRALQETLWPEQVLRQHVPKTPCSPLALQHCQVLHTCTKSIICLGPTETSSPFVFLGPFSALLWDQGVFPAMGQAATRWQLLLSPGSQVPHHQCCPRGTQTRLNPCKRGMLIGFICVMEVGTYFTVLSDTGNISKTKSPIWNPIRVAK